MSPEHIKIADSFKPSISSSKDGDIYTTIFRGGPKGEEILKFKHMEEFNHKCKIFKVWSLWWLIFKYYFYVFLAWTGELVKVIS